MKLEGFATRYVEHLMKAQEENLMKQLNWLVSRGILVVEKGPFQLVQDESSSQIISQQEIELVCQDKEYIEKLEQRIKAAEEKNAELIKTLEQIRDFTLMKK